VAAEGRGACGPRCASVGSRRSACVEAEQAACRVPGRGNTGNRRGRLADVAALRRRPRPRSAVSGRRAACGLRRSASGARPRAFGSGPRQPL